MSLAAWIIVIVIGVPLLYAVAWVGYHGKWN